MTGTRSLVLAALLTAGLATAGADRATAQTVLSACGSLTKGSYKLTRNLTATGHCLTLLDNFTTIDLNGFVITGDGRIDTYGIRMNPAAPSPIGIEIRNGTITNFGTAINLPAASGVVVERVRAVRNTGDGIHVGPHCVIKDNVAAGNGSRGLTGGGCVGSGNTASSNAGWGLILGEGATVIGNTTRDNGETGTLTGAGSTVASNSSRSNDTYGIYVACPSNVLGNTATDNVYTNVLLTSNTCGNNFNVAP